MYVRRLLPVALLCGVAASAQTPPPSSSLRVSSRVDHVDVAGREPMVVEHPGGSLFVASYGNPPRPTLWKSSDRGATWKRVDVGTEAQDAVGNSDVSLAVASDGTLYFVNLLFDRKKMEGAQVSIGVSRDVGATWRWSVLTRGRFADRPWVGVSGEGVAHVIWSDGTGVRHAVSRDRGATWSERARVFHTGGSSHLAAGPRGELAAYISPAYAGGFKFAPGIDHLAISTDGGESWRNRPAPGDRQWGQQASAFPRWVEPLAWDATGALYSFWTNPTGLWMARSSDYGATWTTWKLATANELVYFPYLTARGRGELAVSWFSGQDATLRFHVARIDSAVPGVPRLLQAGPLQLDSWSRGDPPHLDPAGEYAGITLLRDGGIGAATPIFNSQNNRFGFTWWRFESR